MTGLNTARVADELGVKLWQIRSIESLMAEGATVPFIARYRKEQTGSLDEVVITRVRDRLAQLAAIYEIKINGLEYLLKPLKNKSSL
ncbi:MAG: Tex-like N-terminal domain-containing protein [Dehalococcoidales bacterium]|jgi:uncharacterized protein